MSGVHGCRLKLSCLGALFQINSETGHLISCQLKPIMSGEASPDTHTHTQAVTNNNEVFQLCFVTCDLITAFSHHGDRLRSGSPISLNFLTSINCVCCSPFLDVSCVHVCVIYLTTPPGLPIVSAFKHSHGNQTQPNPYRCPGMCEYNTVSTTETGQTHTNTHFLCVRAVYFHLWVP